MKRINFILLFLAAILAAFSFWKQNFHNPSQAANPEPQQLISSFTKAELSEQVFNYIEKEYYDASRIQLKSMLKSGFIAVSKFVPEILIQFPENGSQVTISIENLEAKFNIPNSIRLSDSLPLFRNLYDFIQKNYKGEIELPEIERVCLNGMLEFLDPHSSLLSPKVFKEFSTQTEGEFGGVGIVIGLREGDLTVINPIEGTPASRAGVKAKDKILKIGSEPTLNMSLNDAVEKLRGKINTFVTITLQREGVSSSFDVTLRRETIKIRSVQSKLLPVSQGSIVYLKIKSFQRDTFEDLNQQLKTLKAQAGSGIKGVILDLRGNPGGLLDQAIAISDLFLEDGTVVSTVGAGNKLLQSKAAKKSETPEEHYPMVVLMSDNSASASEIVAGALKNNNRAVIIGEQSFGKGSVQSIYMLSDNSGLKMTIAQYLTPGNESIQSVGITPDILLVPAHIAPYRTKLSEEEGFREKDLEKHLESNLNQKRKPFYQISYLASSKTSTAPESNPKDDKEDDNSSEYSEDLKLEGDFYVTLSRKILSNLTSYKRQEAIQKLAPIVSATEKEEDTKIVSALSQIGSDWIQAKVEGNANVQVSFQVEGKLPNQPLTPGAEEGLTLQVKNIGSTDLYRLAAKVESENPIFKNREFVIGHLKAGEQKSWTTKIKIPETVTWREDELKFVFREANGHVPAPFMTSVLLEPKPKAAFAYEYEFQNPTFANPKLLKAEKIVLKIKIKNIGLSKTSKDTVINLKNTEGAKVVLLEGRQKLGEMLPGASQEALLSFKVDPTYDKPKVNLELSIADNSAQEILSDKLIFSLDSQAHSPASKVAISTPKIDLTGFESVRSSLKKEFEFSGTVTSEVPLKDVLIFVNNNKVFLKAAQSPDPKKIVFTAKVPLEDKNNSILVVSRDERDLAGYKTFYIRKK